jgi:hypothetical protein
MEQEQDIKRHHHKLRLHPVGWIVLCMTATSFLAIPSSTIESFSIESSPLQVTKTFFLYEDPFDSIWGRHIPSFPAIPTDVTQVYDDVDSEDYEDVMEKAEAHCRPSYYEIHPTCNDVHILDLARDMLPSNRTSILSIKGYWRHAWEFEEQKTALIFKTFRLEHAFEEAYYEHQQVDAFVMERFTSSPNILDMYSNCGLTVVTEFAGLQLSRVVDKLKRPDRLKLAKQVTKGVATLHEAGVIHNDLNQANVGYSELKRAPVLFDFNIAILGKECPFESKYANPQWRAPEEQELGALLTEKVDIYALGNILFRFAVGSTPWGPKLTSEEKVIIADGKMRHGLLPPFPLEPANDTATQALLHIMYQCFAYDPRKRPSANRVLAMLHSAIHDVANETVKKHRGHHVRRNASNRVA